MSVPAKLLLLLMLVLFFLITGSATAALISVPLFGYDLKALYSLIENPSADHITIVKFFQIVQSVFLFLLPALIAAWLFSDNALKYLQADRKTSAYTLLLILLSLIIAIPLMNFVTYYNTRLDLPDMFHGLEDKIKTMEENAGELTELFLESNSYNDLAINFLMIAILPALGEELFFRGILQRIFVEWTRNSHVGVILAAFLFSFIHFQFYGFIPRFLLGLYFGYLLVWSSSIWAPVAGHLINNGIAVLYYHFAVRPMGDTMMDKLGIEQGAYYALYLSVFLTSAIIGLIYLHEKQSKTGVT
jgi:membrane protease YdiL (CAAX protease family)